LPKKNAPPLDGLFATVTVHEPPRDLAGWATRWDSLTPLERQAKRERWQEQLRPIVVEMAKMASGDGVTASEVIATGIARGILNGERAFLAAHPKAYSFMGHFLVALVHDGVLAPKMIRLEGGGAIVARRASDRAVSKGNSGKVYVLAELARAAA
jgi:hypothetical protein